MNFYIKVRKFQPLILFSSNKMIIKTIILNIIKNFNSDEQFQAILNPRDSPLENSSEFDARSKAMALGHLKSMEDPTFIVGLTVLNIFFTPLISVTQSLQSRELDILDAYSLVKNVMEASKIHCTLLLYLPQIKKDYIYLQYTQSCFLCLFV